MVRIMCWSGLALAGKGRVVGGKEKGWAGGEDPCYSGRMGYRKKNWKLGTG